jgi:hypothetical protein
MTGFDRDYEILVDSPDPVVLELQGLGGNTVTVPADTTGRQRLYLTAPPDSPAADEERLELHLIVRDAATGQEISQETVFHGRDG